MRAVKHDLERVCAVLGEWDPIGVLSDGDDSPAHDEYDSYAPQLLSMLYAGKSRSEIADRLETLRTVNMGLPEFRERDEAAAAQLLLLELQR